VKALTLTPPWDFLVLRGGKDIENRSWPTKERGWILIHAATGMTKDDYENAVAFAREAGYEGPIPPAHEMRRGHIVGAVRITGCMHSSERQRLGLPMKWAMLGFGFDLADPVVLPPVPAKGALSFWKVPGAARETILRECDRMKIELPTTLMRELGAPAEEPTDKQLDLFGSK
jgi:hypothetical protein